MLRASVDAGAGGPIVTSVTGTANQVTASPTTGDVVVSLPSAVTTTLAAAALAGGATIKWANCTVSGTTITVAHGSGVASVTYNSAGNYTVNFSTNFTNSTFVTLGTVINGVTAKYFNAGTQAVGSCVIFFTNSNYSSNADTTQFSVAFIGV